MRKTFEEWAWFLLINVIVIGMFIAAQTELTP
jgi:hypothetical protein